MSVWLSIYPKQTAYFWNYAQLTKQQDNLVKVPSLMIKYNPLLDTPVSAQERLLSNKVMIVMKRQQRWTEPSFTCRNAVSQYYQTDKHNVSEVGHITSCHSSLHCLYWVSSQCWSFCVFRDSVLWRSTQRTLLPGSATGCQTCCPSREGWTLWVDPTAAVLTYRLIRGKICRWRPIIATAQSYNFKIKWSKAS